MTVWILIKFWLATPFLIIKQRDSAIWTIEIIKSKRWRLMICWSDKLRACQNWYLNSMTSDFYLWFYLSHSLTWYYSWSDWFSSLYSNCADWLYIYFFIIIFLVFLFSNINIVFKNIYRRQKNHNIIIMLLICLWLAFSASRSPFLSLFLSIFSF